MSEQFKTSTVRVSDGTKDGFTIINANDFDHDEHKLIDRKDAPLVPPRSAKVSAADAADIKELTKKLGEAEDATLEAASERDEWKARAEAAEKALAEVQQEAAGKKK